MNRLMTINIPNRNIVLDAINHIKIHGKITETDMRSWFSTQNYEQDYHYFEMRLMNRDNIIRKYDIYNNESIYYYVGNN